MPRGRAKDSPFVANKFNQVSATIGVEAGNVIAVTIQVRDEVNKALASICAFDVYLSDTATGADIIATAPSGGVAVGAKGKILGSLVANKYLKVVTDNTGQLILNITEAGVKTLYLIARMPDGSLASIGPVTFA